MSVAPRLPLEGHPPFGIAQGALGGPGDVEVVLSSVEGERGAVSERQSVNVGPSGPSALKE
jgi:hypothetical protein